MYLFSNKTFVTLSDFGLTQSWGDLCSKLTLYHLFILVNLLYDEFRLCIEWNVHLV